LRYRNIVSWLINSGIYLIMAILELLRLTLKTINVTKDIVSSYGINQDKIHTDKYPSQNNTSSSSSGNCKVIENVLILQGGGSLGAFGCGVFKVLSQKDIDIVAGTSIGVNAAIMAGSKNEKQPEQPLEQFWLELADSFLDLDKIHLFSLSPYLEQLTPNHCEITL
jgi:patatin-like phospholipase/acyl hydrolase